jgi:hypothetical protein
MPKDRQKIFCRKTEAKNALSAAIMVGLLILISPHNYYRHFLIPE